MAASGSILDRSSDAAIDLPRLQAGAQPQRVLTALLADYWHGRPEQLPSAVLVRLLADFEVTTVGARAALSRLARRGLLESSRIGRNTYYGLTAQAAEVIRANATRIMTFGERQDLWDGLWTIAAFSIPEDQRDVRHSVRSQLRWLGFAPLYDGMWITPRPVGRDTQQMFSRLGVVSSTVLTAAAQPSPTDQRPPIAAWDLAALRQRYEEFIQRSVPLLDRVRLGEVAGAEALVARTGVMEAWRRFPALDPDLPLDLLPGQWPRAEARALFAEIYDGLAPAAVDRVRALLATTSPDLAQLVQLHRTPTG